MLNNKEAILFVLQICSEVSDLLSMEYSDAFSLDSYDNLKNALENFSSARTHTEAQTKWSCTKKLPVIMQLSTICVQKK